MAFASTPRHHSVPPTTHVADPFKVYVNNPALSGKVASVLQAGHVLSTRFQPYESHVPFLLQVRVYSNDACASDTELGCPT